MSVDVDAKRLRSSPRWKRVRLQVLRGATTCQICGGQLFADEPPRSPWSSTVDHIVPLAHGGAPFDLSNLRVAHYRCNASRGAGRHARVVDHSKPSSWLGAPRADWRRYVSTERADWW